MSAIEKSYHVYILKCVDESYYTGITNDLERRISEHQAGLYQRSFTYKRRPVTLVFVQTFQQVADAISFEKQVKGWSRAKKEALIEHNFEGLILLAKSRNQSK